MHQEGTARPLPPGVDLTAYRIIQEALTNVTKHAGTGQRPGAPRLEPRPRDHHRRRRRSRRPYNVNRLHGIGYVHGGAPAPGYGLIGMRERATAVGGHLSAGRRPEGGFLVSAQLPLPPAKDPTRELTKQQSPRDG